MNINDAFKKINNCHIKDLIPLKSIDNPITFFNIEVDNADIIPSYEQLKELYGKDIADKCFYAVNIVPEVIFFDKDSYVLIEMTGALLTKTPKEDLLFHIHEMAEEIRQYGLEDERVSWKLSSKYRTSLMAYYMIHQKIRSYEQFINYYVYSEYGFAQLPGEQLRKFLSKPYKRIGQEYIDTLPDVITIYRGQGDESTPLNKAYSWTLNQKIAYLFAIKNSQDTSFVYTATLKKEDIIDYIDCRKEDEILALPEKVQIIHKKELYSIDDLILSHQKEYFPVLHKLKEFVEHYKTFLKSCKFSNTSKEHGLLHMYRVSLLSGVIHEFMKPQYDFLNDDTLNLVMIAGLLHDIGRDSECENTNHGKHSVEMYKKYYGEISSILSLLMECHCLDDEDAYKIINTKEDSQTITLLKILKDADALDRLRFSCKDLDVSYLRFDESKDFLLFAKQLLSADFSIL